MMGVAAAGASQLGSDSGRYAAQFISFHGEQEACFDLELLRALFHREQQIL